MDLRHLEYVVAVADEGGFTAGADALRVAQPSVSQAVRAVEAELGVELFHRLGRGAVLSAAGESFVAAARQVLRDVSGLKASVGAVRELVAGRLDLVALPTLAVDPLAPLIGRFRQAYPGVGVRLLDPGDAVGASSTVRSGQAELGVVDLPIGGEDLTVIPLGDQELFAVCGPGMQATGGRVRLRDLAGLSLVAPPPGTSTRRVIDAALVAAGLEMPVAVEVDQREAIVALVLAGAGFSILPEAQAKDAERQGAVVLRPEPSLVRSIALIHRDRPLSPAAVAFLDLLSRRDGRASRTAR